MFIVFIRTIVLYFLVVITIRMMGKRQIGELQPFELVITIMISELASLPIQDTRIPIIDGIIPIITLLSVQVTLSILQLKSEKVRELMCGKPNILILDGKIDIKNLRSERFNINDLMEELRLQGYYNLEDIKYAILETSGQLSIIPKTELSNINKLDLKIPCQQELLPVTLILDGKINKDNLKVINKDNHWLLELLKEYKISSEKDVFIALLDSKGRFFYQLKKDEVS